MPSTQAAVSNRLLAKLPRKDRKHFLAGCEPVDLPIGAILADAGTLIDIKSVLDRGRLAAAGLSVWRL